MPTTPEPTRLHTPPAPTLGAQYDTFEPYSPRRTTRATAQRNPYSSKGIDRPHRKVHLERATTPPPTFKRTRTTSFSTYLSSPPISPPSPDEQRALPLSTKTPKKALFKSEKPKHHPGALTDVERGCSSLATPASMKSNMFPTPVKTPNKRQRTAANPTARILNFQPGHHSANDLMPARRTIKQASRTQTTGFELYEGDRESKGQEKIEIFTDTKDRVPIMDKTEDNPFLGESAATSSGPKKGKKKSRDQVQEAEGMDESARNDEGVMYMFRGRKIFRRFTDPDEDADTEVDSNPGQQSLKHQAGSVAQRPLTRSAVKPRLLFPTDEQLRKRTLAEMVDEEAPTDIEMTDTEQAEASSSGSGGRKTNVEMTPMKGRSGGAGGIKLVTPPPTKTPRRATRSAKKADRAEPTSPLPGKLPSVEENDEEEEDGNFELGGETPSTGKKVSPFAGWQRTKGSSAAGKKRPASGGNEAAGAKKSRSAAVEVRLD